MALIKTEAWFQEKFCISNSNSEGAGVGVDNDLKMNEGAWGSDLTGAVDFRIAITASNLRTFKNVKIKPRIASIEIPRATKSMISLTLGQDEAISMFPSNKGSVNVWNTTSSFLAAWTILDRLSCALLSLPKTDCNYEYISGNLED